MLDYTKTILQKVSFDQNLFRKELHKSFKWLNSNEVIQLKFWVQQAFGNLYGEVIHDTFMDYKFEAISLN